MGRPFLRKVKRAFVILNILVGDANDADANNKSTSADQKLTRKSRVLQSLQDENALKNTPYLLIVFVKSSSNISFRADSTRRDIS
jgi:hypothetical protein